MCRSTIERTFEHRGVEPCVNPDFLLSGAETHLQVTATRRVGDRRE